MSEYIDLELALNELLRLYEEDIDAYGVEIPETFDYHRAKEALLVLPTIEVSEDCISREHLKSFEYINKGDFNSVETIREWIDHAPSVVPSIPQEPKTCEIGFNEPVEAEKQTIRPTDDCISREQVRAKLDYISYAENDPITIAKRIVDNAPSVVPTPKEGEWIIFDDETNSYKCTACGEPWMFIEGTPKDNNANYCPNCGARMKGVDDE